MNFSKSFGENVIYGNIKIHAGLHPLSIKYIFKKNIERGWVKLTPPPFFGLKQQKRASNFLLPAVINTFEI